jgi:V/A-type H+-transporting ATPase subunit C
VHTAVSKYAFLNARVSLFAQHLIPEIEMCQTIPAPVEELGVVLTRAGLGEIDPGPPLDTELLDRQVSTLILDETRLLSRDVSSAERDFLQYWAQRFELANLKTLIRGRYRAQEAATIRRELLDLGEFATLRVDALLTTEDVPELLRMLESNPRYAGIARNARHVFEERHELFTLEASIDRQYYAGLARMARGARSSSADPLLRMVDTLIDRVNLVWLLRFRVAYGLSPAEAYYLLIPAGRQLSQARLLQLAEAGDVGEVVERLPEPMRVLLEGSHTISEVHRVLKTAGLDDARTVLHKTRFNFARAFAYLQLREHDLRRLASILKGRALQLDPMQIGAAVRYGERPENLAAALSSRAAGA